jgi:hypothetical protein
MQNEIDNYGRDYILNISIEDLCNYLEETYRLEPPNLKVDDIYVTSEGEANLDISQNEEYNVWNRNQPYYIRGTFIEFAAPFTGDSSLFGLKPSRSTVNPPYGIISTNNEVRLRYSCTDHNPDPIRVALDQDIKIIQRNLEGVRGDVSEYNTGIKQSAQQYINSRKNKLLGDLGMVNALGFPIRKYSDTERTYTVPVVQKKLAIQKPVAKSESFKPEPILELKNYDDILKTISDMALVIERNPKSFCNLKEEDIRTFFLLSLNGIFEGNATGETFNYEGKTDILIRVNGCNIFIAECKFWEGQEHLRKTIDQLLGYTSWRDTKTAILLFNRNKDFSSVLERIPGAVISHQNFKRQLDYQHETAFRFAFGHRDDGNRELLLTIIAFNMPT